MNKPTAKRFTHISINHQLVIIMTSICISIASFLFYFFQGLTLKYNDATSHLDIARRITDSLRPGLVQIGSNWLPLLHLLEMPLAANYTLWQTGIAGSSISMISFCLTVLFLYKTIYYLTHDKIASYIAALVFISNANMLYMQTAAMFEPLLIATSTAAIYYLIIWEIEKNIAYLLLSGLFVLLASITRYDGWMLCITSSVVVFLVSWKKWGYKSAEGKTIMFITLSGFGIAIWLFYNQLIFGKATYFMSSEFSARGQQILWEKLGKLPAKHNLVLATLTYSRATIYNTGVYCFILALSGAFYVMINKWKTSLKLCIFLVLTPYFFNILSLYLGQSIIWVPELPPYDDSFFNVRYGLLMVPAAAIFIGIFSSATKQYIKKIVIMFIIILQAILFYNNNTHFDIQNIAILRDTKAGNNNKTIEASKWLGSNCKKGLILISAASYESMVFYSGLYMNHFITEGMGSYWISALNNPKNNANCVVIGDSPLDEVKQKLVNNHSFHKNFLLAQTFGGIKIYESNKHVIKVGTH